MGFLRRLFGGGAEDEKKTGPAADPGGIYLYVACDRCHTCVRLRVDKQYDLNHENGGYVWHKTIVDNRCFRPMTTVVHFDGQYNVVKAEIEGGHYITADGYEDCLRPPPPPSLPDEEAQMDEVS